MLILLSELIMLPLNLCKSVLFAGLITILFGCGSGGSSKSSSTITPTPPITGVVNFQLTDGPSTDFDHVWVTITAVSMHAEADAVWSKQDSSWHTTTLSSPITIDLAALSDGSLSSLFSSITLPVGAYKQIRLFLAGADDNQANSAKAIMDSSGNALQWNDQIEYSDNSNTIHEAPLEVAYPTQGIQLTGSFTVDSQNQLYLAIDFDLEHDVVPYKYGSLKAFTLKPNLHYFDLSQAGTIVGHFDNTKLCTVDGRNTPTSTTGCAYDLVAKAELLSTDGKRHYAARSTHVNATTGAFSLYPLMMTDAAGATLKYDVVIRGRQMETEIITGVQATIGSDPTHLQTTSLPIYLNSTEYQTQFNAALNPLTSGYSVFQQTISSGGAPYEIRWANTDPFTGKLYDAIWLQTGPVQVAPYIDSDAVVLTFTATTPIEGSDDAYTVGVNASAYFDMADASQPVTQSTPLFDPSTPTLKSGIADGSITFNLTLSNMAGTYDSAEMVITRLGNIMATKDVSALIGAGSGSITLLNIPAGTTSNAVPGAYYYAYLRVWNSTAILPFKTRKILPVPQMIDLRKTNSAQIDQMLDGNSVQQGL